MRIRHNQSSCASLGLCEEVAPDLFEVGDDGVLRVLDDAPDPARRALVERAVAACPTRSLTIDD